MPLRLAALDPADEYFLDAAQEYEELDPTSYLALRLFGDRDEIHYVIDAKPIPREGEVLIDHFSNGSHNGWRDRQARCEALKDVADRILERIDPSDAGGLVWAGIRGMPRRLRTHAEIFAFMAYEDRTIGGAMEPYRQRRDCNVDRYGNPTKKLARRLHSPRFIRWFTKNQPELRQYIRDADRQGRRVQGVPHQYVRETTEEIELQLRTQHRAEEQRRYEVFRADHVEIDWGRHSGPIVRLKKGMWRTRRKRRKLLRRVASSAITVIGRENVSKLIRKGSIDIVGQQMKFRVGCRFGVAHMGHGAIDVAVHDLDDRPLATLCYFYEKTPALEQVTALALDVAGGEEMEVLKTANLTLVTDAGHASPLLADRIKPERFEPLAPLPANVLDVETRQPVDRYEIQGKLQKEYWARTSHIWIDALCSRVFPKRELANLMIRAINGIEDEPASGAALLAPHILAPTGYIDETAG